MEVVKLIQPHEFGDNFIFEDGKWKVKFPPIPESGVEVSKDANNLITLGEGGGDLYLHQTLAPVEEGLCHVVGNSHLVVPQIELVDVAGNTIGYISDIIGLPVSSQTHGPDHCPK